ncbi:immunoglobulin E-set [Hyaloraphidium curvatum]|nr:immunoglobulin E-set [Hyaloraphidium curvatum]
MAPLATSRDPRRNAIPVIVAWGGGGKAVYVTGSFNGWKQKVRLNRSEEDFTTILDLPPGTHHFKFVVDDEWRCSDELPCQPDDDGNLVNVLEVYDERGRNMGDGLDDVGDQSPTSSFEEPSPLASTPVEQYSTAIPSYYLPAPGSTAPPPISDPPPPLPPQLEKVILNAPPSAKDVEVDVLPPPNHVTLNHLYACSIKDGVMAVAGTTRYRRKVGRRLACEEARED